MKNISTVILAAGEGKRMGARKSKVLCNVLLKPMINWVIDSAVSLGIDESRICLVCPPEKDDIVSATGERFVYAVQKDRLGTAHAVSQAREFIEKTDSENILVLLGDAPLISDKVLENFCDYHIREESAVTVLSASVLDPKGYGRIVRDEANQISKIVEEIDCSEEEKKICEINSGVMCFRKSDLLLALDRIDNKNNKGEYYLTSAIDILKSQGKKTGVLDCKDEAVVLGANNRAQLLKISEVAKERVIKKHLDNGVEFISLDSVVIGPDVKIGQGAVIYPGVVLAGRTVIGKYCTITSGSHIENSVVGDESDIKSSYIVDSVIGNRVRIGPFSNIRPNCNISDEVKIGDFVEIKNSNIGNKTSVAHLTYVGDSDVGRGVNFGCGCVTVNYNGKKKARTVIGDNCFIGCNTNLIAPVTIGDNVYTAAGSTVTDNVPDGAMCIARSRQVVKENWKIKD